LTGNGRSVVVSGHPGVAPVPSPEVANAIPAAPQSDDRPIRRMTAPSGAPPESCRPARRCQPCPGMDAPRTRRSRWAGPPLTPPAVTSAEGCQTRGRFPVPRRDRAKCACPLPRRPGDRRVPGTSLLEGRGTAQRWLWGAARRRLSGRTYGTPVAWDARQGACSVTPWGL
jgi:hypothetical protein